MSSTRWGSVLLAVVALAGCKEEEDKPPLYSPVAVPGGLVPCEALHEGVAQIDPSGVVRYDGGLAECFPETIVCTVGLCDGGVGVARCLAGHWLWGCEPTVGPDAGPSSADAGSHDDGALPEASSQDG